MSTDHQAEPDQTDHSADLERLAATVDAAAAEVAALEPEHRGKATALRAAIEEFHKVGLTRIVRLLKADPRGKELLLELAAEPEVYALFAMHGLVRADLETRVARVIEMVRPYLQSHGGDVALVDVREGRAFVQLSGSCNGCSMSSVTLRTTVEESLKEHVPEIEGVEVVPAEPLAAEPAVFQIAPAPAGDQASLEAAGWVAGPAGAGETSVLVIASRAGLRAFRNACPHAGMPLERGICDDEGGTITCPWHGFRFDSDSGECFTAPQCQLEAFPLRVSEGLIWVRPS